MITWSPEADEGVRLFNARRFYECHDVWEEIWMELGGDERTFYQGLIQIAVGLYKVETGNHSGARSLLRKGIDKLALVPHVTAPIRADALVTGARCVLDEVERLGQTRLGELDRALYPTIVYRDLT